MRPCVLRLSLSALLVAAAFLMPYRVSAQEKPDADSPLEGVFIGFSAVYPTGYVFPAIVAEGDPGGGLMFSLFPNDPDFMLMSLFVDAMSPVANPTLENLFRDGWTWDNAGGNHDMGPYRFGIEFICERGKRTPPVGRGESVHEETRHHSGADRIGGLSGRRLRHGYERLVGTSPD